MECNTKTEVRMSGRNAVVIEEITFPFVRGERYALRKLKEFEAMVSRRRAECADLSNALRDVGSSWWVKLRNDELIPLEYLAEHQKVADDAVFCIMQEGSDIDIELTDAGSLRRLQMTTAGPIWMRQDGRTRDWGYDERLKMQKLNDEGSITGWGPFEKEKSGVRNREEPLSREEIRAAFAEGLARAFKMKSHFRTPMCELAVHLVGSRKLPERLFCEIIDGAAERVVLDNFTEVHVFDGGGGHYACMSLGQ
jgi:hypothetical protein